MHELRKYLNDVWAGSELIHHASWCAELLFKVYGREYNVAYMLGLALFLYFNNTESLSDEEFDSYVKAIMSTSKDNKCKQIYARS
jgi:hypothetical protein